MASRIDKKTTASSVEHDKATIESDEGKKQGECIDSIDWNAFTTIADTDQATGNDPVFNSSTLTSTHVKHDSVLDSSVSDRRSSSGHANEDRDQPSNSTDEGDDETNDDNGSCGGDESVSDGQPAASLQPRRLRPQRNHASRFATTWMDNDPSEDYDPAKRDFSSRSGRGHSKRRKRRRSHCDDDNDNEDEDASNGPHYHTSLMVKLSFIDEGKRKFANKVADLSVSKKDDNDQSFYKLRKRRKTTANDSSATLFIDGGELQDDLTGWPLARGCRACAVLGLRCSILDDEHQWPCEACSQDNLDCELVTQPQKKRTCQRCKSRKAICSYERTQNHTFGCQDCVEAGLPCIAGPYPEAIIPRIRYVRTADGWTASPQPKKKKNKAKALRDCQECQIAGTHCLRPAENGIGPCKACADASLPCTDDDAPNREDSRSNQGTEVDSSPAGKAPEMPTGETDKQQSVQQTAHVEQGGEVRTIMTRFAHPINFNYQAIEEKACHFCIEPLLAFFGFGLVCADVIDYPNDGGYVEISRGHTSRGTEQTRLCEFCTALKMSIVTCLAHDIQPIANLKVTTTDLEESREALNPPNDGNDDVNIDEDQGIEPKLVRGIEEYCSICPDLAEYECTTGQGLPGLSGCGLKLCELCMMVLTGQFAGDLQSMLAVVPDKHLRADIELLKIDGPVMKFINSENLNFSLLYGDADT